MLQQAYALGKAAIERAASGETDIMLTINRLADEPYQWDIGSVPLTSVANVEKKMPKNFITPTALELPTPAGGIYCR